MKQRLLALRKKNIITDEWIGWPVWIVTTFLAALIVVGVIDATVQAAMGRSLTEGGAVQILWVQIATYGLLLTALFSIRRIRLKLTVPQHTYMQYGILALAAAMSALYLQGVVGTAFYLIASFLLGMGYTLTSIPVQRRNFSKESLGVGRWLSWGDIGLAIAGYVILCVIVVVINFVAMHLFPGYDVSQKQDLGFTALLSSERILAFIALVIVAPLSEELMMRGFLFGKLREAKMPFWLAALVVSALFALAHGQWNVGIMTFVLSMIACYLRESTGAIWSGVVIHMAVNCLAYTQLFPM